MKLTIHSVLFFILNSYCLFQLIELSVHSSFRNGFVLKGTGATGLRFCALQPPPTRTHTHTTYVRMCTHIQTMSHCEIVKCKIVKGLSQPVNPNFRMPAFTVFKCEWLEHSQIQSVAFELLL